MEVLRTMVAGHYLAVRGLHCPTKLRNMFFFLAMENGAGEQMKTFGFCSIDVHDSKNDFGMSAPPEEKYG